jgi:Bacteriophage related domain of unknown function
MSATTCRKAITDRLKLYSGDPPIFAENVTVPSTTQGSPWARWSLRVADAFDADVGGSFERMVGTLYFQHFQPEGSGTLEAYQFADKVGQLLNRKVLASTGGVVYMGRAVCAFAGQVGGLTQHNVTIEFREESVALNAP